MIEQLTTAHYKKMRWKNGSGYTVELARSEGESLDVFDWRISMADVKLAGEFSKFHGMQRILTVLEGQGIVLNVDDDCRHLKILQSVQFSGEREVSCELPHGQIQDFNLIYDPKKVNARYQWISEPTTSEIFSSADLIFIFNQSLELLEIEVDQQVFHLQHQESLKIQHGKLLKSIVLRASLLKRACLIELKKV